MTSAGSTWVTAHNIAIRIIASLVRYPGSLGLTGHSTIRLALPNGQRFRITVTEEGSHTHDHT